MTYSPAERVTCPHVTQCNISGWQIKNPSFRFRQTFNNEYQYKLTRNIAIWLDINGPYWWSHKPVKPFKLYKLSY